LKTELSSVVRISEYIQLTTTVNDEKKAKEIAKVLLENRMVACVQIIGPIKSSGWWKDKIIQTNEWMCLAKAKTEDFERIEDTLKKVHPYDLPEILAVPIFGNLAYLNWIHKETASRL